MQALPALGFASNRNAGSPSSLVLPLGGGELHAVVALDRHWQEVVQFNGCRVLSRAAEEYDFAVPLEVESLDVLKAWIAFGMGGSRAADGVPEWTVEGWANRHLLPWEQERRRYEQRPRCVVARRWLRHAINDMQRLVDLQAERCEVAFDGKMLTFRVLGEVVPCPATGDVGPFSVAIPVDALKWLPKRLLRDPTPVEVWDGRLVIGSRAFALLDDFV